MTGFLKRFVPKRFRKSETIIPVVRLQGTIAASGGPLRPSLNLAAVAEPLEKAFTLKGAPAVAISINSPGGSPVQSRLIYQRIRALAEDNNKKVIVFVEDVAASGGYMIALAGDEIIADPTSIVGSIGVVSGGFGFPELIKKIGVERRVYTAGENKVILDPFKPEKQSDIDYLLSMQAEIHKVFVEMVQHRRKDKLKDDETIFSGLFWTGMRGLDLGLIDGLGEMRDVLRRRYGKDVKLQLMGGKKGFFARKIPGVSVESNEIGAGAVGALAQVAEDKALWGRYGL